MFAHLVSKAAPKILALGLAAAAGTATVGATPAAADDFFQGRVNASGGLAARAWPTSASQSYGTFPNGRVVSIICKIRGSNVDGNDLWYLIAAEGYEWSTARYITNIGASPRYCDSGGSGSFRARTTTTVTKRASTTTAAAAAGTVPSGTTVSVVCKLDGQSVGGNTLWYYTQDGRWLSARYLTNVGAAPAFCQ